MDGLKPWARMEIERRDVKDTATAMTIADSLPEYTKGGSDSKSKAKEDNPTIGGGAQEPLDHPKPRNGGGKQAQKEAPQGKGQDGGRDKKPRDNCFLCGGPHWARDCPKKNALNALLEGDEEAKMGCIQLLGALKASSTPQRIVDRTPMYVEGRVNEKTVPIMLDTGATHNFIQPSEAARIGLKTERVKSWMKTVNGEETPLEEKAKGVEIQIGTWRGKIDFTIAPMDDFKCVLGMDFFHTTGAVVWPTRNVMLILEGGLHMVTTTTKAHFNSMYLSAMRVEHRRGSKLAARRSHGKPSKSDKETSLGSRVVLGEYKRDMPAKSSKRQDHEGDQAMGKQPFTPQALESKCTRKSPSRVKEESHLGGATKTRRKGVDDLGRRGEFHKGTNNLINRKRQRNHHKRLKDPSGVQGGIDEGVDGFGGGGCHGPIRWGNWIQKIKRGSGQDMSRRTKCYGSTLGPDQAREGGPRRWKPRPNI